MTIDLRPIPLVLRAGPHAVLLLLLGLVVARALDTHGPGTTNAPAGLVVALAIAIGVVDVVGVVRGDLRLRPPHPRAVVAEEARSVHGGGSDADVPGASGHTVAGAGLLGVIVVLWLGLLATSTEAVWLAFPLFFLALQVLPTIVGAVTLVVLVTASAVSYVAHTGRLEVGAMLGPALGAAFAAAAVHGHAALARESERRRILIAELTQVREDLAAASRDEGMLAERDRLAREIHDTLAQGLSSIQLLLRAAERVLGNALTAPSDGDVNDVGAAAGRAASDASAEIATATRHVTQARETAAVQLDETRRLIRAWTSPELDAGGLADALMRLAAATEDRSRTPRIFVHVPIAPRPLGVDTEQALLRVAQSAVANAVRHAAATRVDLTLTFMDDEVALDIVDDGRGFDAERTLARGAGTDSGFGLPGMRARARALGGTLTVESEPGAGTAVVARVPWGRTRVPHSPAADGPGGGTE